MPKCEYCKAEVVQMADLDYCPECEVIVEGHTVDDVSIEDYERWLDRERPWWLYQKQESEWIRLNRQSMSGSKTEKQK